MFAARNFHLRPIGRLGVMLLTLSLCPIPLPTIDAHPVGHRHGKGEVCAFHDHLNRFHASAGAFDPDEPEDFDVHWHWLLPSSLDAQTEGRSLASHGHDHLDQEDGDGDCDCETVPEVLLLSHSSFLKGSQGRRQLTSAAPFDDLWRRVASPPGDRTRPTSFGSTLAPRATLATWLHRWTC